MNLQTEFATPADRKDVERLIAAYHTFEGITPNFSRISWAVDRCIKGQSPGILLVARDQGNMVGVALGVYTPSAELGSVFTINDFYVEPKARRIGVGRSLALRILEEARRARADVICLEVLPTNRIAMDFWKSVGFETSGRTVYFRNTIL